MDEEGWMEEILEREIACTNSGIASWTTVLIFTDLIYSVSSSK